MKKFKFSIRYFGIVLVLAILVTMTFLLPLITLKLSDYQMMKGRMSYDFHVDTYDGREIPLEDRIRKLAEELGEGKNIAYIQLADQSHTSAQELCSAVNSELEKLGELGFGDYAESFELDEKHLTEYVKCNLIAGYSSKVWCMKWAGERNPKETKESYQWFLDVVMDCETQKILAIECDVEAKCLGEIFNSYRVQEYPMIDFGELSENWLEYLEFGELTPFMGKEEYASMSTENVAESTVMADVAYYDFYVGFPEQTSGLPARVCYVFPYLEAYGNYHLMVGFPLFFDI